MKILRFFRFNRIYWKLFFIIWLTNLVIIAVVAFMVAHGSARSKYEQNYQTHVRLMAEVIIDELETNNALPFGKSRLLAQLKRRHRIPPNLLLDIKDTNGNYVYKSRWRNAVDGYREEHSGTKKSAEKFLEMPVVGESMERYTVLYLPHRPPRFIVQAMASLLSIQLILLFVTSAVISALISWRIVKPLSQLGRYGQQYATELRSQNVNNGGILVDAALLNRGDEIGDLARDINNMVAQVDKAFSAQKSLLHDVSHELRAPLARLQVAASLIEKNSGGQQYVDRVHSECARLNALIDEVLELARMDSAQLSMAPLSLVQCVEKVVNDVRFEMPERDVRCDFSALPLPVESVNVVANSGALSRALENIVRNACKYSPANKPIDVSIAPSVNKGWAIICRDYGVGINPEDLALLKQPFYRGGGLMHGEGFGLGLSIAEKSIKQHGGELLLTNHPDGGLQVTVVLMASV